MGTLVHVLNAKRFFIAWFAFLVSFVTIIGCGGGGGGGNSVAIGPVPITYAGITSQAPITAANAVDLATESLIGAQTGSVFSLGVGAEMPSNGLDEALFVYRFPAILHGVAANIDFSEKSAVAALVTESDTIIGSCGGSVSYTLSVEDTTGVFSGSFVFTQYCDGGIVISGPVAVDGSVSLITSEIEVIHFNFNNVSSGDITLSGDVATDQTGMPVIITMDFRVRDNVTGKVFWVNDYSLSITETSATEIEVDLTGTYYHHDFGYITIATPVTDPLVIDDTLSPWPKDGIIIYEGEGNTSALLTVIDQVSYRVVADTDGDGSRDNYDSGDLLWADL